MVVGEKNRSYAAWLINAEEAPTKEALLTHVRLKYGKGKRIFEVDGKIFVSANEKEAIERAAMYFNEKGVSSDKLNLEWTEIK
jgi:hypothetical protein